MANPLLTPITIMAGTLLPSSAPGTPQFTATKKTVIKWIELNNTDSVARTVTFYTGAVTDANQVFKVTLDPAGTMGAEQQRASSAIVEIGGITVMIADAASKVRAAIYGATFEMV
jgi:hypothetical protein